MEQLLERLLKDGAHICDEEAELFVLYHEHDEEFVIKTYYGIVLYRSSDLIEVVREFIRKMTEVRIRS